MQEATSVRKLKINISCMKARGSGVGFVLPCWVIVQSSPGNRKLIFVPTCTLNDWGDCISSARLQTCVAFQLYYY